MSRQSKAQKVTEAFVIQGTLKEMMRSGSVFIADDGKTQFKIVDLLESSIREGSDQKKILLKLQNEIQFSNRVFSAKGGFYRNLVELKIEIIEGVAPYLAWAKIPSEVHLFNLRENDRTPVKPELRRTCPVLLVTNGVHCEGAFSIEDTSHEGVGGVIQVPSGFPCAMGTEVRGNLILSEGELQIRGTLARATQLDELKYGYDAYRIGIKQEHRTTTNSSEENNLRKHERHLVQHELTLVSLLHPDQEFKVRLVDISISGFSAEPEAGSVLPCVPVGSVFSLVGSSSKAVLTNFDDNIYRFQITSRTEADAIDWLRTMTPLLQPGAQCSVGDARELYKIFLQAGAISTQYLKRHELYEDSLVKQHANIGDESGYLHRWYVKGENDQVEAHISSIRLSNNCWFIGDLAKVSESSVSGVNLIRNFFTSFSALASEMAPTPGIMGIWLLDHPLWKKWDESIQKQPDEIITNVIFSYFRVTLDSIRQSKSKIRASEIFSSHYSKINLLLAELRSRNLAQFFATALDFDYNLFGSKQLARQMPNFSRRYFEVEIDLARFLVVYTNYEVGQSVNRIMDSIYAVQLGHESISIEQERSAIQAISTFASELGVVGSSVRLVFDPDRVPETGGQKMRCFILTPKGFSTFDGFK